MSDAIAALAKRFWRIHPNEIPLGITREQYYEQEMRALVATQATRIETLEARLDRAVTRGLEQVEHIATLEAALRDILGAHDLYETECIASAALASNHDTPQA
jgi:hypothetical protein